MTEESIMLRSRLLRALFNLVLMTMFAASAAYADHDARPGLHHAARPARSAGHGGQVFRDPHWVLDSRFHHDLYYPRVGYALSILPPGYLDIGFHNRHFFFNAGVWFVREGPRYVVAVPPAGVIIPVLPPAFTTIWIGSSPYYYANGIYYAPVNGGYVTVVQPPGYEQATVMPPPPAKPAANPSMAPANDLVFIYPRRNQSEAKMTSDRTECSNWASGKTGYDPNQPAMDESQRGDYLRAISSCLESRGYGVK
jgi:hypothetical protein